MNALDLWGNHNARGLLLNNVWDMMDDYRETAKNQRNSPQFFDVACDIDETNDHFVLSFDVPGIDKENIHIEAIGNSLVVSGERQRKSESEKAGTFRSERSFGSFQRSFTLPEGVNSDLIEADYSNGVLQISIAKAEEKKAKKISIGTGSKGLFSKLTARQGGKSSDTQKSSVS